MGYIIGLLIALFIGWATPQPALAKKITDWTVAKFKEFKAELEAAKKDDELPK